MDRTPLDNPRATVVAPDFHHVSRSLDSLTAALWCERELLDQLLFALTCQRYLLEARALRWLAASSALIGQTVETLREHEVLRAAVTEELATELDLPEDSTLAELISAVDSPVDMILSDLAEVLRASTAEVDLLVRGNDELLLSLIGPDHKQHVAEHSP